jgi:choline kinase
VIGLVLAAGFGQRLLPYTAELPKTLVPVHGERTILDVILANLAEVGLREVHVVVGHAAEAVHARRERLAERYGLDLRLITNDRPELNNAYSLWRAREAYAKGALLVNGDTLHPVGVPRGLLAGRGPDLLLAVDARPGLTEEAMKVRLDDAGRVAAINKALDIDSSYGEYIGVALIESSVADKLTDALERTWRRYPQHYYEDAFQVLVDAGAAEVRPVPIGEVEWVEVDDPENLATARDIACRY